MKSNLEIGILYLSLHNLLLKKADMSKIITRKDFFCYLGKHFLIPKQLRHTIIKEMEDRKLLRKIDNKKLEILEIDFNIEEDTNKLYKMVGLL